MTIDVTLENSSPVVTATVESVTNEINVSIANPTSGGGGSDYTLPTATSTVLGGVKVGTNMAIASGVINPSSAIVSGAAAGATAIQPGNSALTDERVPTAVGLTSKFHATNKATLADADEFAILDSESTSPVRQPKNSLWSTIKTALADIFAGIAHKENHAIGGGDLLTPDDISAVTLAEDRQDVTWEQLTRSDRVSYSGGGERPVEVTSATSVWITNIGISPLFLVSTPIFQSLTVNVGETVSIVTEVQGDGFLLQAIIRAPLCPDATTAAAGKVTLATAISDNSSTAVTSALAKTALDAKAMKRSYQTANFTAAAFGRYHTAGTITVTDPTSPAPAAGDIFEVTIASGTAVIGGVTYSPSRFPIEREYNGSAWVTLTPTLSDALAFTGTAAASTLTNLGASANGASLLTAANYAAMQVLLGLGITDTPTHGGLKIGTTTSRLDLYRVDDGANYERVALYVNSTEFRMVTEKGGTGTVRNLALVSGSSMLVLGDSASSRWTITGGVFQPAGTENQKDIGSTTARIRSLYAGTSIGVGIAETPTAGLDLSGDKLRVRTAKTPATSGAAGNAGDICWDADYIYVCTATNTWKRSAIATW
jgi:hypothetical protein